MNYKLRALLNGEPVIITAHKPLPHTGHTIEVKSVEAGSEL